MFGYVLPYKLELKIKDYEMFKAYYCGLCVAIKNNFSNTCRLSLNYDMTFLAVLLDSLSEYKNEYQTGTCIAHPVKKRVKVINNKALNYASFVNVALVYYKLLDDYHDDNNISRGLLARYLKHYIKNIDSSLQPVLDNIEKNIGILGKCESSEDFMVIDQISDSFADLTGFIIAYYYKDEPFYKDLYNLGYNLGRWIYLIDAYDDLQEDMKKNKFNAFNKCFNEEGLPYEDFIKKWGDRMEFNLIMSANATVEALNRLPLKKNQDLLYNILQLGLMHKIETIKSASTEKE